MERLRGTGKGFFAVAALAGALLCPHAVPALSPEIARDADAGLVLLYRLEFESAFAHFDRMKVTHPGHPAAPALEAAGLWWQSRYAFATPDDETTRRVRRNVDEAVEWGKKMAREPGWECESKLFIGGAQGVGAHWNLLLGNWFRAVRDARSAVQTLEPLLDCPEFADEACFGLGMYEYAAAKLPWHLRWLSRILISGMNDRDRALERISRAATRARFVRSDAQGMLVLTYTLYDPDPPKAVQFSTMMVSERPNSPMAAGLHLQALCFATRFEEAERFARRCLAEPGSFRGETATFRLWQGVALLGMRRPAEAAAAFAAGIAGPGRPTSVAACRLKRGCALDALGRREDALRDYKEVSLHPDPWKESERAKIYLARPFTWEDFPREISPRGY